MFALIVVIIIVAIFVARGANKRQQRQFEHERSMLKERNALYSVTPERIEKLRKDLERLEKLKAEK